jgi:hypothetical protein
VQHSSFIVLEQEDRDEDTEDEDNLRLPQKHSLFSCSQLFSPIPSLSSRS